MVAVASKCLRRLACAPLRGIESLPLEECVDRLTLAGVLALDPVVPSMSVNVENEVLRNTHWFITFCMLLEFPLLGVGWLWRSGSSRNTGSRGRPLRFRGGLAGLLRGSTGGSWFGLDLACAWFASSLPSFALSGSLLLCEALSLSGSVFPRLLTPVHLLQKNYVVLRLALFAKVFVRFLPFGKGQTHTIVVLPR